MLSDRALSSKPMSRRSGDSHSACAQGPPQGPGAPPWSALKTLLSQIAGGEDVA